MWFLWLINPNFNIKYSRGYKNLIDWFLLMHYINLIKGFLKKAKMLQIIRIVSRHEINLYLTHMSLERKRLQYGVLPNLARSELKVHPRDLKLLTKPHYRKRYRGLNKVLIDMSTQWLHLMHN